MTEWRRKRFWTVASLEETAAGWAVRLDGRPVKTPAKAPLVLPAEPLARAIADEWQAQGTTVDPATMPLTRMANTAIDGITPKFAAVAEGIAAYGASDLLCYRATAPAVLAARQAAGWDPLLDWAAGTLGARLVATQGVMPVVQPPEAVTALTARVTAMTPFQLAALHDLVAIPGSLVLGLAVAHARLSAEAAFDLSRIDERWQAELWGADDEATESMARKRDAMAAAGRFFGLCG